MIICIIQGIIISIPFWTLESKISKHEDAKDKLIAELQVYKSSWKIFIIWLIIVFISNIFLTAIYF